MSYALPPVLERIQQIGGQVFTTGAYNLNLFGIRSPNRKAGKFDDLMGCAYKETDGGPFRVHYWPATCDPGVYWLENPMRVEGCAALVADRQYPKMWSIGMHRGSYKALVQTGDCAVYRDDDRDRVLSCDPDTIMVGKFGINGHKAGSNSTTVGKWSAGCQVVARLVDFQDMMQLAEAQQAAHPGWTSYTYTLLNRWW